MVINHLTHSASSEVRHKPSEYQKDSIGCKVNHVKVSYGGRDLTVELPRTINEHLSKLDEKQVIDLIREAIQNQIIKENLP